MAQGSRDGIRKPVCNTVLRARGSDLDLVRELPYGPRHMTAALRPDRCQHPTYAPVVLKDFPCSHGGVHRCCILVLLVRSGTNGGMRRQRKAAAVRQDQPFKG